MFCQASRNICDQIIELQNQSMHCALVSELDDRIVQYQGLFTCYPDLLSVLKSQWLIVKHYDSLKANFTTNFAKSWSGSLHSYASLFCILLRSPTSSCTHPHSLALACPHPHLIHLVFLYDKKFILKVSEKVVTFLIWYGHVSCIIL